MRFWTPNHQTIKFHYLPRNPIKHGQECNYILIESAARPKCACPAYYNIFRFLGTIKMATLRWHCCAYFFISGVQRRFMHRSEKAHIPASSLTRLPVLQYYFLSMTILFGTLISGKERDPKSVRKRTKTNSEEIARHELLRLLPLIS